jgi:predicted TIM-barrel fold metal-dependent hydrolase
VSPNLDDWLPQSQLVLPSTDVPLPLVPAVDAHNHLGRWLAVWDDWMGLDPALLVAGGERAWAIADVGALIALLDEIGVEAIVNLDGLWGDELERNLDRYDRAHPDRFATFCHVDVRAIGRPGFDAGELVESLRRSRAAGARGLKIWKDLGLAIRDADGALVLPDDQRLGPIFAEAGELGLPVLIHTADPVAFFEPADGRNERLEELLQKPEWAFHGRGFPSFSRLMQSLESLLAAHPGTTFIVAHVGCHPENLHWVDRMLTTYPNMLIDVSGRMAELGRQPRAAARLISKHRERVLFGTDVFPPPAALYRQWYRFLESDDEHFPYGIGEGPPSQGRWAVSALHLPAEVLEPVYRTNARRVLGLP